VFFFPFSLERGAFSGTNGRVLFSSRIVARFDFFFPPRGGKSSPFFRYGSIARVIYGQFSSGGCSLLSSGRQPSPFLCFEGRGPFFFPRDDGREVNCCEIVPLRPPVPFFLRRGREFLFPSFSCRGRWNSVHLFFFLRCADWGPFFFTCFFPWREKFFFFVAVKGAISITSWITRGFFSLMGRRPPSFPAERRAFFPFSPQVDSRAFPNRKHFRELQFFFFPGWHRSAELSLFFLESFFFQTTTRFRLLVFIRAYGEDLAQVSSFLAEELPF